MAISQARSRSGGVAPVVRATEHARVDIGHSTLKDAVVAVRQRKIVLTSDKCLRNEQKYALRASFKKQDRETVALSKPIC